MEVLHVLTQVHHTLAPQHLGTFSHWGPAVLQQLSADHVLHLQVVVSLPDSLLAGLNYSAVHGGQHSLPFDRVQILIQAWVCLWLTLHAGLVEIHRS